VASAFSAADYGAYDSITVYAYLAAVLGLFGLDSAVILFARPADNSAARSDPRIISHALGMVICCSGLCAGLLVVGRHFLSEFLLGDARYSSTILWAGLGVVPSAVLLYLLSVLKWEFRRAGFLLASLGAASVSIALTYVSAFHTTLGLPGLFIAGAVGQLFGVIVAVVAARDLLTMPRGSGTMKRMLAVGVPFALVGATAAFAPSVDRFVLARFHSLAAAGLYGVGQKIAMLQALVLSGFQAAWGPFAFALRTSDSRLRVFPKVLEILVVVSVAGAAALTLIAPWIAGALGSGAYGPAARFVAPLALGAGLNGMYFVLSIGVFFEARSGYNLIAYLSGLVVMVALNAGFIMLAAPPLAVAWANCAGQAAAVLAVTILSQRVHPLPFRLGRCTAIFGVGSVMTVLAAWMAPHLTRGGTLVALLVVGSCAATWTAFSVLEPGELRLLLRRAG
jgi:O-antigen/teichoic acid export membrane protein